MRSCNSGLNRGTSWLRQPRTQEGPGRGAAVQDSRLPAPPGRAWTEILLGASGLRVGTGHGSRPGSLPVPALTWWLARRRQQAKSPFPTQLWEAVRGLPGVGPSQGAPGRRCGVVAEVRRCGADGSKIRRLAAERKGQDPGARPAQGEGPALAGRPLGERTLSPRGHPLSGRPRSDTPGTSANTPGTSSGRAPPPEESPAVVLADPAPKSCGFFFSFRPAAHSHLRHSKHLSQCLSPAGKWPDCW